MSARAAVVLAAASLCAACGDAPQDEAAKVAPESAAHGTSNGLPAPIASPNDSFVGTWQRNGALTFEASRAHFDRLAALRPEAERAPLMEEARLELQGSPWTLVVAEDGTLVLDAMTRTPGTGALEQQHWSGVWTRTDAAVELVIDTTRPGAEPEITKLNGVLSLTADAGAVGAPLDRLTIGGPAGNPRGQVLEFERARD
jgi:hypothetical protein